MLLIDLSGGGSDFDVWTTRPSETIWAPDWVLFTPHRYDPESPTGIVRWLRTFPPPDDQFWITGRGSVFTYSKNPAQDLWNPDMLRGQYVVIDNGLYQVGGVEMFRPIISPTQPYGDRSVGILVRPATILKTGAFE